MSSRKWHNITMDTCGGLGNMPAFCLPTVKVIPGLSQMRRPAVSIDNGEKAREGVSFLSLR
jgi:hypothetical protein